MIKLNTLKRLLIEVYLRDYFLNLLSGLDIRDMKDYAVPIFIYIMSENISCMFHNLLIFIDLYPFN